MRADATNGAELAHNAEQVRYFEHDAKPRMVPRPSRYLERHLNELLAFGGFTTDDRLLEIGAGMGRYTIPLLQRGYRVEACDLSEVLLSRLREYARPRPVTVHQVDAASPPQHLHGQFDGVIGLFMLHHVHDVEHCLAGAARMLKPGGRVAFLEPNAFNPLFYLQMAITPGMTWAGDGGVARMRVSVLHRALAGAGFVDISHTRFGFLPPMIVDRPLGPTLERALERVPIWRPLLPFQVVRGRLA